jgi:glycosyltransferase involved in cell wall biosynthesis
MATPLPTPPPPSPSSAGYRVSAIVSTYNSERFIRGCLEDLVHQTLFREGQLEVVVVNSGSAQNEESIVREFQSQHRHITYLRTAQRESLYAAWNRGIAAASGPYVTNANTDDRHRADALERMALELDQRDVGLVYADSLVTRLENETFAHTHADRVFHWPEFSVRQHLLYNICGPQPMWRRSLHDMVGWFDPEFVVAGDYDFFLRITTRFGAYHLREVLGLYLEGGLEAKEPRVCGQETERLLAHHRAAIPLERIYPGLGGAGGASEARAAAMVDWANLLLTGPYPDRAGAEQLLARALELHPGHPAVLNNLAVALCYRGESSTARGIWQRLPELQAARRNLEKPASVRAEELALAEIPHPIWQSLPPLVPVGGSLQPWAPMTSGAKSGSGLASAGQSEQDSPQTERNIVYVSREFGPITGGGIGTYIENVTRDMARRGHRVFLVTECFNADNAHLLPPGVRLVTPLPVPPNRRGCYLSPNHEYSDRVYLTLKELARITPLDVVEFADFDAEGFVSIQAKRTLGEFARTKLAVKLHTPTDLVSTVNGMSLVSAERHMTMHMEQYALRHCDLLISPSRALAAYAREHYGVGEAHLAGYPLEPLPVGGGAPDQRLNRHVLFAARLEPRKGLDVFLRAALAILEEDGSFVFHIAGKDTPTGPFGRSYRDDVARLVLTDRQDRFVWHGPLDKTRLAALYRQCQFCVIPSRWENYANVALEAMSYGCVVLASSQGGLPEIVADGSSGLVIDPSDVKGIARRILTLAGSPADLERISQAARERACYLRDPDRVCREIERVYALPVAERTMRRDDSQKVSVIIPLYNQGEYVAEAIASVRESTYRNVEIIVVNDGSTDPATNAVFEQLDGVIKVAKPNGGLGSARNAGLAAAAGDYVVPLDADDKLHPDFLRKAVTALDTEPALAYVGCFSQYFGTSDLSYLPIGYVDLVTLLLNTEGSCTKLFRREALRSVGGYDGDMVAYEDWDLIVRLNAAGHIGDVMPELLFLYRQREKSMNAEQGFRNSGFLLQHIHRKQSGRMSSGQLAELNLMLLEAWRSSELHRAMEQRALRTPAVSPAAQPEPPVHWKHITAMLRKYGRRKVRRIMGRRRR